MTSEEFVGYIREWNAFYLTTGAASATLIGLLFVGLSLNVDEVMSPERPELRALAEQAFASFTYVLLISLFLLVPEQEPEQLAIILATLGSIGLLSGARRLIRSLRSHEHLTWGRRWLIRRFLLPGAAYALSLVVAVGVAQRQREAVGMLLVVVFILLTSAADSSWDLLVKVSEDKRLRRQRAEAVPVQTAVAVAAPPLTPVPDASPPPPPSG